MAQSLSVWVNRTARRGAYARQQFQNRRDVHSGTRCRWPFQLFYLSFNSERPPPFKKVPSDLDTILRLQFGCDPTAIQIGKGSVGDLTSDKTVELPCFPPPRLFLRLSEWSKHPLDTDLRSFRICESTVINCLADAGLN